MEKQIKKAIAVIKPLILFKVSVLGLIFSAGSAANQNLEEINQIRQLLSDRYVIGKTAAKLSKHMESEFFKAKAKSFNEPSKLAGWVTQELNDIAKDKHLAVIHDPEWVAELRAYRRKQQQSAFADKRNLETPSDNYGFQEVKILAGNIGYIDLRSFADSHLGGDVAVSAMNFLQYTDGLIIDLRKNFGGSPYMLQLLASYFFDVETQHLSSFETRRGGKLEQFQDWTLPYVPGKRFINTPLYILTSHNTASAAEGFSYALQNMQRATLVGEPTAGAAHGRSVEVVSDRLLLSLPSTRPIDPRTNTNWEGSGVNPDIVISSDQAMDKAHALALEALSQTQPDKALSYLWALPLAQARLNAFQPNPAQQKFLAGRFGERVIFFESDTLFYQHLDETPFELSQISSDLLIFNAFDSSRIRLHYDNDTITAISLEHASGEPQRFERSE